VNQQPAVVVEAGSAADVAQAVRYARAHGIRIAPQSTGHGAGPLEPLEPLDGTMLLRTTRVRTVRIDPAARTARAVHAAAGVGAAEHVLDIGCGTGRSTRAAGRAAAGEPFWAWTFPRRCSSWPGG
jgi:FAD binding domain